MSKLECLKVAIWNGLALGGGAGITQSSQIRIATEKTQWAYPECNFGFFPDCGASYFLSHLEGLDISVGLYLAITGKKLNGKDLLNLKIATHFIEDSNLDNTKK
jgi:3-hydroxyisobutyryl-CoA hydrolase